MEERDFIDVRDPTGGRDVTDVRDVTEARDAIDVRDGRDSREVIEARDVVLDCNLTPVPESELLGGSASEDEEVLTRELALSSLWDEVTPTVDPVFDIRCEGEASTLDPV